MYSQTSSDANVLRGLTGSPPPPVGSAARPQAPPFGSPPSAGSAVRPLAPPFGSPPSAGPAAPPLAPGLPQAPPLPGAFARPQAPPFPLGPSPPGATVQKRDDNVLAGVFAGSRPAAVPPPLAPSAAPRPFGAPPPSLVPSGATPASSIPLPSPLPPSSVGQPFGTSPALAPAGTTPGLGLGPVPPGGASGAGLGWRPKPAPIETSLTPRVPSTSSTQFPAGVAGQARDSAVLSSLVGGQAPPSGVPGQTRDSSILSSIVGRPTAAGAAPAPPGGFPGGVPAPPTLPGGAGGQARDGAVLTSMMGQGPPGGIGGQARDSAVLGRMMGGQAPAGGVPAPPGGAPLPPGGAMGQARDGAVLNAMIGQGPTGGTAGGFPPPPSGVPAPPGGVMGQVNGMMGLPGGIAGQARDNAILGTMMGSSTANPLQRRDDAVMQSITGPSYTTAAGFRPSTLQSHDDSVLGQLTGQLGAPGGLQSVGVAGQHLYGNAAAPQFAGPGFPVVGQSGSPGVVARDDAAIAILMGGAHTPGTTPTAVRAGGLRQRTTSGVSAAQAAASARRMGQSRGRGPAARVPRRTRVTGMRQGGPRDILETRAATNLEDENIILRKHQNDMKHKLQQLEVKLRRVKSPGREGQVSSELVSAERELDTMAEVENLQKAMSLSGRHGVQKQPATGMHNRPGPAAGGLRGQRQGSQRCMTGGRLRGRMQQQPPWPKAVPESPQGRAGSGSPGRMVAGRWPDSPYGSPSRPVSRPGSPQHAGSPRAGSPSRSGFLGPNDLAPSSMLPAGVPLMPAQVPPISAYDIPSPTTKLPPMLGEQPGLGFDGPIAGDEVSMQLWQETESLRGQKRQLSQSLDEMLVSRISEEKFASRYKDKSKLKDAMIQNLEKALERERRRTQQTGAALQGDLQRLSTEVAVARDRLHCTRTLLTGTGQDAEPIRQRLKEMKNRNAVVTKDIRDLTVGAFGSADGQRAVGQQALEELTQQIEKKVQDVDKLLADQQRVDLERGQAAAEAQQLEGQCRTLMEENERMTIRMEEKAQVVARTQSQLAEVLENLDEEDRKVLTFSLQFLREREAAKKNQQLLDSVAKAIHRPPGFAPGAAAAAMVPGAQLSVEQTTHVVDNLRAEKDELAQEVFAIQGIVQREKAITKDLRSMHQLDVDEVGLTIQVTMEDTERCKRLALEREKRIQELQKELVKRRKLALEPSGRPRPPGAKIEQASDIVSQAGFSGIETILDGSDNALDLYLTVGRIEERALLELPRRPPGDEVPPETSLVTMVFMEFLHFDVSCSEEASTLRPRYDSLTSFGPFEASEQVIEHFATGYVRFELQAFSVGGTAAYTLGRASLPLAVLLDCTPQDPNPVVTGTLSFAAESDARLQIATITYKAKWRKSILEALAVFAAKSSAPASALADAAAASAPGAFAAPGLFGAVRTLLVQVRSVTGLTTYRPGVPPEALRPYVSYEVPHHPQKNTGTMAGATCNFQDTGKITLRIDAEFCRWANQSLQEGGGLHFLVFDSNAPVNEVGASEDSLGVLGEVKIPLASLLMSPYAQVQGAYPLQRGTGVQAHAAGIIDLHIRWQDEPSVVVSQPGIGGVAAYGDAGTTALTEEKYQITWNRVTRRLHVLKMTASDWFHRSDLDKDGFWTKQEARMALSQMLVGLSPYECEQIFDRMDMRRRGLVSLNELGAALADGSKAAPLEQWARDVYKRMAEALGRQGQSAEQAFCAVARGWQAQKREFFALITSLDLGMKPEQLEWLWKLTDANSDGLLDFREFAARLREVSTMATTAYTLPRPDQDVVDAPGSGSGPAWETGPMSDLRVDLCLLRLLRSCSDLGWRTVDRVMQELGAREDGAISRAVILTFCLRARARLSDWEVDQVSSRLDFESRGTLEPRSLRAALLRCDISTALCVSAARRAAQNMGRMRHGLMAQRLRSAAQPSAVLGGSVVDDLGHTLMTLLSEIVAQKAPMIATRLDLQKAAKQLGVDSGQEELDELWAFADKMRDGSLDVANFVKRVVESPLPGEGAVDSMTDEHFAILMGRVKKALERLNAGGVQTAFSRFLTSPDGCLSPVELENALAQVLDNLSPNERRLLVGKIDTNKDGRISLAEMEAALMQANVAALGCWADDICKRIANSLRHGGKSLDDLFNSLAKGGMMVHWPAFDALFTQMEPTLTTRQLQQLWQAFDKNNDGGVSREEFLRAFTVAEEGAAPESGEVAPSMTDLLLSRIHRAIGVGAFSVKTALALYDTEAEGSLDWQQWRHACRSLRLPLSEPESAALHNALARGPGSKLSLAVLEAGVARVAMQVLPEERWARTFVSGCAARALESGAPALDQVLGAGGEQAVEEAVLLAALSRHHPVAEAQWLRLRPLLERRPEDGQVLWQAFLRWASVPLADTGAGPPGSTPRLAGAEADVCKRVSQALRREGKSLDTLFTALAKGGIMFWPDFVTLFASLEPTLTVQQLQHLWKVFDKNGDGGVNIEEFRRGFVSQMEPPPPALAIPPTPSHGNVCSRIKTALRREGKTVGDLFQSLSKGTSVMQWSEFTSLFIQLEPSLSVVQLERLWKSFDKDGDGCVSRDEFERGLATDVVEQPGAPSPSLATDVCRRVATTLSREGMTVDQLFTALAKDASFVFFPAFADMFAKLEPSLSRQELENLWRSFDEDGNGGVDREEFVRGLAIPQVSPVKADVCRRVVAALSREGMTVDQLFDALANGAACVTFAAFADMFAKLEPSLSTQELEHLWKSFDADGSGGVDRAEFVGGLTTPQELPAKTDVCRRVVAALSREGMTVDQLFDALAAGASFVMFPAFADMFAKLEPGLSTQELEHLWKSFDADGNGGVDRAELVGGLTIQVVEQPMTPGSALHSTAEVRSRIRVALQKDGKTVDTLFTALAKGGESVVLADFVQLFAAMEPSLTQKQLEHLWKTFDKNGDGGVSREEFTQGLAVDSSQQPSPRDKEAAVCARILAVLQKDGKSVDDLFVGLAKGGECVQWAEFATMFADLDPTLTAAELLHLWRSFDKNGDGGVSREEFMRGLAPAPPPAGVSEESVLTRVQAVLKREGKTANELYIALAKGGPAISWAAFLTLFIELEPGLTGQQLQHLWKTFDKDGDGGVSHEEFCKILDPSAAAGMPPPLPPPSEPPPATAVEKLLEIIAEVVAIRSGTVFEQLRAFDKQQTGKLDSSSFAEAIRSYSPGISEEMLAELWAFLGGLVGGVHLNTFAQRLASARKPLIPDSTMATPTGAFVNAVRFYSAFRRIRSVLHSWRWSFCEAFDNLVPPGTRRLPSDKLNQGLAKLGCMLSDGELTAFFAAMAKSPQEGASYEEFATTLSECGEGFDEYGREVLGKVGHAISADKGSIARAFESLDVSGRGAITKTDFRDILSRFGDMNLTEGQQERLWQLAIAAGAGSSSIDFPAFRRLFQAAPGMPGTPGGNAARASSEGFKMTLEEACEHFATLSRIAGLKAALERASPEGFLPTATLSALVQAVAPELSPAEVDQLLRLAPRKGGPLHGTDAPHDWRQLVIRFESGRGDWDPVDPAERMMTADVCRFISQQVEAQNYRSFQDYVAQASTPAEKAASSLPAVTLLNHLQKWLPGSEDYQRVAEFNILRLGQILPNGCVDLAEFYARFERLAKGGPLGGIRGPAGAGVGLQDGEPESRTSSQGPACLLDFTRLTAYHMCDMASLLQRESERTYGSIAFDKLLLILEANKVAVTRRLQGRLKTWLGPPKDNLYYWPPLFAFTVSIDRIIVTADKHTRTAYPSLQLQVSFCGEAVKFPPFGWSVGMMQPFEPKKMTRTQQCNARFNLDGPWCIGREDLAVALSPQPPPTHILRISLFGSDRSALDTTYQSGRSQETAYTDDGSYNYHLGSVEMRILADVPKGDLHPGATGTEKRIAWHLPVPRQGPSLNATLNISTRNAGRLWVMSGQRGAGP